jgi:hypothetical protein
MAEIRTRKNKQNPHYGFLVSWNGNEPKTASVKRETKFAGSIETNSARHAKKADSLAQAVNGSYIKKDLLRSLATIGFVLILELVVYLAWIKFIK